MSTLRLNLRNAKAETKRNSKKSIQVRKNAGANPTTYEFTAKTPAV
jgi:hypothetical protein